MARCASALLVIGALLAAAPVLAQPKTSSPAPAPALTLTPHVQPLTTSVFQNMGISNSTPAVIQSPRPAPAPAPQPIITSAPSLIIAPKTSTTTIPTNTFSNSGISVTTPAVSAPVQSSPATVTFMTSLPSLNAAPAASVPYIPQQTIKYSPSVSVSGPSITPQPAAPSYSSTFPSLNAPSASQMQSNMFGSMNNAVTTPAVRQQQTPPQNPTQTYIPNVSPTPPSRPTSSAPINTNVFPSSTMAVTTPGFSGNALNHVKPGTQPAYAPGTPAAFSSLNAASPSSRPSQANGNGVVFNASPPVQTFANPVTNNGIAATTPMTVGIVPQQINGRPNFIPLANTQAATAAARNPFVATSIQSTNKTAATANQASSQNLGQSQIWQAAIAARIGQTGQVGEDALKALGGESQKFFNTSMGARYVDQFVDGVAHESKVGYQVLSEPIETQIEKDAELVSSGQAVKAVWHFFTSPQTGKAGPSQPLEDSLNAHNIQIEIDAGG